MKKKFQKQEEQTAKEISGKRVTGSGSQWHSKGDVKSEDFLIECKTTRGTFYTFSLQTWLKIKKEALRDGMRIPVMQIDLEDGKYRICVLDYLSFRQLGFDEDYKYVMPSPQPFLQETKQMRLSSCVYDLPYSPLVFPRIDYKFVGYQEHLVVLRWEEFLYMKYEKTKKAGN